MTLAERIIKRLRALDLTPAGASKAAGFAPTFVRDVIDGRKEAIRSNSAIALANVLRTSPEWLLEGRGEEVVRKIPIVSYVGAGAQIFPIDEGFDEIDAPPGCGDNSFAVIVRGDSMVPALAAGDIIIAEWISDPASLIRRRAIIDLEGGARMVKELAPGSKMGTFTLLSHNASPIYDARVERAARIILIYPA